MVYLLLDTAIAASADDKAIFTYVQIYYGELVESISTDGKVFESKIIDLTSWETVKLFTPLATTLFKNNTRYLFYLDNGNIINDLVNEDNKWKDGDLGKLGIAPANYSKLAAVTTSDRAGDIREVVRRNDKWEADKRDFGDPPLFGTSLAAVRPESGITIHAGEKDPVVFFQEKFLKLAELQGNGGDDFRWLKPIYPGASPHTPLAAAVDGHDAYLFYTSDDNMIQRIAIRENGSQVGPLNIDVTTPKGNIATVIWKGKAMDAKEQIIVFYQPQYQNIITQTSSKPITNRLAAASSIITGSGANRALSAPVISEMLLHIE